MQTGPKGKSGLKAAQDSYVSAASDAIRHVFSSGKGIATSLSKDSVTMTFTVPRSGLSRGQVEAIMAAHMADT